MGGWSVSWGLVVGEEKGMGIIGRGEVIGGKIGWNGETVPSLRT